MANTETILVNIPNKIAKKFGDRKKKSRSPNLWSLLAIFNPKLYWDLVEKINNKRRR